MKLPLLAILCCSALSSTSVAETASWSQLTPYPTPITNNAVTSVCDVVGCTIYSFMGMADPNQSSSIAAASYELQSPGTGFWIPIADAPLLGGQAKIAASAVTCGGKVYLIGGYTVSFNETTEHRLFRYDTGSDSYVQLADVPTKVDDTVVGVYQDRYIYLTSGWHGPTNGNTQAVQAYDTQTDTWQQATPIPVSGRFGHAGGIVDDRIVFIDGSSDQAGFPVVHSTLVGTIDPNDLTVVSWNNTGASPFTQTYRTANALTHPLCDRIMFAGGTDNPYNFNGTGYNGQPSNPLDQVMVYAPSTNEWSLIDDSGGAPHAPTMDHRGLVPFNGNWVTVGGMTAPGVATTSVNVLDMSNRCLPIPIPAASTWGMMISAVVVLVAGSTVILCRPATPYSLLKKRGTGILPVIQLVLPPFDGGWRPFSLAESRCHTREPSSSTAC